MMHLSFNNYATFRNCFTSFLKNDLKIYKSYTPLIIPEISAEMVCMYGPFLTPPKPSGSIAWVLRKGLVHGSRRRRWALCARLAPRERLDGRAHDAACSCCSLDRSLFLRVVLGFINADFDDQGRIFQHFRDLRNNAPDFSKVWKFSSIFRHISWHR